jgi:hypothetical protein
LDGDRRREDDVHERGGRRDCGPTDQSFYAATQAVERELTDVAWALYRLGDDAQRGLVDLAFDVAALSVNDALARTAEWTGQVQEGATTLSTQSGAELAWVQTRNNFEVYNLVKNVRSRLRLDQRRDVNLVEVVEAAYALGAYADLWAIEGLGHDYTDLRLDSDRPSSGIMRDGPAAALPASSLTMMHAGLGLALAERMLRELTPCSSAGEFREVVTGFLAACDAHARPGYAGAAYESLGLITRTWHPRLVARVAETLLDIDDIVAAYFWHGAGRALYFLPAYIVPVLSPWRAADREAPHALAHDNLYAGLAWAWTLVNIRHPRLLAELLRTRGERLQHSAAFANGVASALVVAVDITPDDPYVTTFASYAPDEASGAAAAWHATIVPAVHAALNRYHPVLRAHNALEAVFRYTNLGDLVAGLERDDPAEPRHPMHNGPAPRTILPADRRPGLYPSSSPL